MGKVVFFRLRFGCEDKACKTYIYPLDKFLQIGKSIVTKNLSKCLSAFAIMMPFIHAKKFIKDTMFINISETLLKNIVYKIGSKLASDAERDMTSEEKLALFDQEKEPEKLYIEIDGSLTPIKGEKKREYKENKLAIIFTSDDIDRKTSKNGKERVEIHNKKFVSTIGNGVDPLKKCLKKAVQQKGAAFAKVIIFLSDGAHWLINLQKELFPNIIRILDWYHAVEHLWESAHELFGIKNKKACESWVKPLKDLLWEGKILKVLEMLKETIEVSKNPTPLQNLFNYYDDNKEAMKYNKFREKGYYIGSGAIESANKYIVAQRLKLIGMRWTIPNANAIIWMRCKYFEDTWDQLWEDIDLDDYLYEKSQNLDLAA